MNERHPKRRDSSRFTGAATTRSTPTSRSGTACSTGSEPRVARLHAGESLYADRVDREVGGHDTQAAHQSARLSRRLCPTRTGATRGGAPDANRHRGPRLTGPLMIALQLAKQGEVLR